MDCHNTTIITLASWFSSMTCYIFGIWLGMYIERNKPKSPLEASRPGDAATGTDTSQVQPGGRE